MADDYLTSKELLRYLKISKNSLYKLRNEGMPIIKIGKKVLFRRVDVNKFLATHNTVVHVKNPKK